MASRHGAGKPDKIVFSGCFMKLFSSFNLVISSNLTFLAIIMFKIWGQGPCRDDLCESGKCGNSRALPIGRSYQWPVSDWLLGASFSRNSTIIIVLVVKYVLATLFQHIYCIVQSRSKYVSQNTRTRQRRHVTQLSAWTGPAAEEGRPLESTR